MNKVRIIGVGPGAGDYLLPIAKREAEKADCLIGARRLLGLFAGLNKEKIRLEGNLDDIILYIKEHKDKKKIAVLVSGDPGLHSFLGRLSRALAKEEYLVIPGISAMQTAFAKIGESWQGVKIISLHGRQFRNLAKEVECCGKVFLFTDPGFPPNEIAARLLAEGVGERRAVVFENLSYPDERIIDTNLKGLSKMKGFGLCVMIIIKK